MENNMLSDRLVIKDGKLMLLCVECGEDIGIYQSDRGRIKQFCEDCIKKHRREKDKRYYKKTNYWASEKMREYRRRTTHEKAQKEGYPIDKRYDIFNCIICNKDISDRSNTAKYCKECGDHIKDNFLRLGTGSLGSHIRTKKRKPDFDKEKKVVIREKRSVLTKGTSWFVNGKDFVRSE